MQTVWRTKRIWSSVNWTIFFNNVHSTDIFLLSSIYITRKNFNLYKYVCFCEKLWFWKQLQFEKVMYITVQQYEIEIQHPVSFLLFVVIQSQDQCYYWYSSLLVYDLCSYKCSTGIRFIIFGTDIVGIDIHVLYWKHWSVCRCGAT